MSSPLPLPLYLPASVAGRIVAHGLATYPEEACGMLIGIDKDCERTVVDAIDLHNNWSDLAQRRYRFTIDPKRQMEIEKSLEGTGKSIIGSYHTHPDHPAEPSDFDLEAAWAFYSYLIVSIKNNRVNHTRAWVLDESADRFVEQPLITEPSPQQLQSDS